MKPNIENSGMRDFDVSTSIIFFFVIESQTTHTHPQTLASWSGTLAVQLI